MNIMNRIKYVPMGKKWSLDSHLSAHEIQAALGSAVVDKGESSDHKATHRWDFYVDDEPCGIWDYKGARWSAYGPKIVFEKLRMFPVRV